MPSINEENDYQTEKNFGDEATDNSSQDNDLTLYKPHVCIPNKSIYKAKDVEKDEVHESQNGSHYPTRTIPPAPGWPSHT